MIHDSSPEKGSNRVATLTLICVCARSVAQPSCLAMKIVTADGTTTQNKDCWHD